MNQPSSAELTPQQRALIDETRELVSPSPADAARVKSKLWTALELGEAAAAGGEPLAAKSSRLGLTQRVGLLAVGLGIGIAVGYGLRGQVDLPAPASSAMGSNQTMRPAQEDHGRAVAIVPPSTGPAPTLTTPVGEAASYDARRPQHRGPSTQRVDASPAPRASETPVDEVEWVQRVQRALAKREPQLALGLLRHLDETVPHGRLLEERRAAAVIAHCLTSPEEGRARAAAFQRDFAQSVHLARIQGSCDLKLRDE